MTSPELQLAVIDVKPGAAMESQSGLQLLRPRIYGAWAVSYTHLTLPTNREV